MSLKVRNTAVLLIVGLMLVTLASSVAPAAGRVEVGSRVTLEQDYAFHGKAFLQEGCLRAQPNGRCLPGQAGRRRPLRHHQVQRRG